ncbi:LemA family protein [Flavobacterium oreochromis]|nr:LemA family protein [Flavobacterium oreochromis]
MLSQNTEKFWANIDVVLKQRADEIPNLINIIKEYVKHEDALFEKLTLLRTNFLNANSTEDKIKTSNEISNTLKSVFAVSESYPVLMSNTLFLELQQRVSQLEDKISERREFYNDAVNLYNIAILEFPNFIMAKLLQLKSKKLYEITNQEKLYDGIKF